MVGEAALHSALESILGEEQVFQREEAASYAVDGLVPQAVAMPESVEQVAEVTALAHREKAAVIPWGGGTAMGLGNTPRRYDIALCLARLNNIVEYEPADLTVTVRAGKTLADLQRHLAQNDHWLPLDPPSPEEVTIGGVLCALSVKMDAWAKLFPTKDSGGPVKRSEFILSEMRQGVDKIQKIDDDVPMLAGITIIPDVI